MTAGLAEMVGDYLRVRRALGYKLSHPGCVLTGFLDYLTTRGTDTVTIENALGFATAPVGVSPRRPYGSPRSAASPSGRTPWTRPFRFHLRGCYRPDRPEPFPTPTPTTRSPPCSALPAGAARRSGRRASARCWP